MLASVLLLVSQRHKLTVRSMGWSAALAMAEAGVEEALSHWHTDRNSPGANGWVLTNISGQTVYAKARTFDDGSYFQVTTYNPMSTSPVIYSAGFFPSPLEAKAYISRLVKVTTTNPPSIWTGIAANQKINLTGNVLLDGFDGSLGPYDSVTNHNAGIQVATNSRLNPAVDVNTCTVYGQVVTGPGGVITISSGGSVGDLAWVGSNTGIQPGATNNNMNVAFSTNAPPAGGPFLAPLVTAAGGSNAIYLGNVTNQLDSFRASSFKTPIIVTGKATLWITGDLTLTGNAYIQIEPGASLTLYVGGAADLGGRGVINTTGAAANFTYCGLSSNTALTYRGTSDFVGTVNAPQAAFTMKGTPQFYGAAICNTYSSSGTGGFHYDKSLAGNAGFVVLGWREL
jgi:hypothetical protein